MLTPAQHRFAPLILIFACLIGLGAYMLISAPANQKPGSNFTAAPVKPSGSPEEIAAQQQFLLKHYSGETTTGKQAALVARIGMALATRSEAKTAHKPFRFHLLAEPNRIDSFAFPGGDVYVTTALINRMHTEGELASVLANGVAHVLLGHQMQSSVPITADAPANATFFFTREQESAADPRTLQAMADAGYNPESMISMFRVLTEAYKTHADVPFFVTHPSDEWRLTNAEATIKKMYPQGVPGILSK